MKRKVLKFIPIFFVAAVLISTLIFFGVTLNRDDGLGITEKNLALSAKITGSLGCKAAFDRSPMTSWSISRGGSEAVIDFGKEEEINALVINEVGFNVTKFSVYAWEENDWRLCYRQNEIGVNRIASFAPVITDKIRFVADEIKEIAMISDIRVYCLKQRVREESLRVTSYVKSETLKQGRLDAAHFDAITDVQLFPYAMLDEYGKVTQCAEEELSLLKDLIGERKINIFLTYFSAGSMAELLKNHMETAVNSVTESVLSSGAGGADFDWEYPNGKEEWRLYSEFIVKLHEKLQAHGKQLSIALSPWGVDLSQEAVNAIDQLQLMSYDLFDFKGDNNSYTGGVETSVGYFLNCGFKASQLNLGISYYGRPQDGRGEWYDYNDPRFTPDESIMYQDHVWFNTPTTARDKTVYAILKDLGGMMVFAQHEDLPMDHPLSLTKAIQTAKNTYSKEADR